MSTLTCAEKYVRDVPPDEIVRLAAAAFTGNPA
jgi:hypothetical protein